MLQDGKFGHEPRQRVFGTLKSGGIHLADNGLPAHRAVPRMFLDNHVSVWLHCQFQWGAKRVATNGPSAVSTDRPLSAAGDGGLATSAEFDWPYGIAWDQNGDMLIADTQNNRIREVSSETGVISTLAGGAQGDNGNGGPASAAELTLPGGITTDQFGNLFIPDEIDGYIREIVNGVVVNVVGGPTVHAPSVTSATVVQNSRSASGLVITPNSLDAGTVTNFQITDVSGGTLYLNDGVTPIADGEFITAAQGAAGLKFSPTINSSAAGGFEVQASYSATVAGLGGGIVTANINVTVVAPVSSITALGYRTSGTSVPVSWSGTVGSGGPIASYNVFVSTDDGAFTSWLNATATTSDVFSAQIGHAYGFISQAKDSAGNLEPMRTSADTTVTVMALPWQYPGQPLNVLGQGDTIVPADALAVINYLNLHPGNSSLPATAPAGSDYYDVLGDNSVVPADALAVIDYLNLHPTVDVVAAAVAPAEIVASGTAQPAVVSDIASSTAVQTAAAMDAGLVGMNSAATAAVSIGTPPLDPAVMAVSLLSAARADGSAAPTTEHGLSEEPTQLPLGRGPLVVASSEFTRLTTKQQVADSLFADPSASWWDE